MFRGLLALGAFAFYGAPARADFGDAGTLAISAERLFGLTYSSVSMELGGVDVTSHQTVFSALNDASPSDSNDLLINGYSSPRIAADYFVIPGLSVGGSLGFATFSSGTSSGDEDDDGTSGNGIAFTARAGYAFMFTPIVGLWPRGGLTYLGAHSDPPGDTLPEDNATAWAFTLEAPLVITPIQHVAFLVVPFWDIGFAGSRGQTFDNASQSIDATTQALGVQAAITGYF